MPVGDLHIEEAKWREYAANLDLCGQILTDGVQQRCCGLVSAHQHQLQVHVAFDQEPFGHETDPHHSTQQPSAAGLSVSQKQRTIPFTWKSIA